MNNETQYYTFTLTHPDGTTVSLSGNKERLYEIVEDFKEFLRGATYGEVLVDSISYDESKLL